MSVGDRYRVTGNGSESIWHGFPIGAVVTEIPYHLTEFDPDTAPDSPPVTRWVAHERSGIVQHVTLGDLEPIPAQEKP